VKLARAILTAALEAPVHQLARNAGQEPSLAIEIAFGRPDCALNPADLIINSVHRAVEGAAQAPTINGQAGVFSEVIERANGFLSMQRCGLRACCRRGASPSWSDGSLTNCTIHALVRCWPDNWERVHGEDGS
jgi:hypothetical protein